MPYVVRLAPPPIRQESSHQTGKRQEVALLFPRFAFISLHPTRRGLHTLNQAAKENLYLQRRGISR